MWKKTLCLTALLPLLSGCSLSLIGKASDRPAAIARIQVVSDSPGNRLTTAVKRELQSRHVEVTDAAPLTLHLSKTSYTHPLPTQFNAGVAFTTTATLTTHYELTTHADKTILGDTSLSESQSLFHNANQVNTTSRDNLFQRELAHKLASSIYFKLAAENTVKKIKQATEANHATQGH